MKTLSWLVCVLMLSLCGCSLFHDQTAKNLHDAPKVVHNTNDFGD